MNELINELQKGIVEQPWLHRARSQYTVYSIQYTVYSIQYTVYSIQYTVYSQYSILLERTIKGQGCNLVVESSARMQYYSALLQ